MKILCTVTLSLVLASAARAQEAAQAPRVRNVAVLVFPDVELLDFAGPGEVFACAHNAAGDRFRVYTVARERTSRRSMGFLEILPEFTVHDCPPPDIVVVPGGSVPAEDVVLQEWLRECARTSEVMLSVCNGATLFATAGLLDGLEATTHHSTFERLAALAPTARVWRNRRFVDNGQVVTTAGISAGIDGSLHVVARLLGEDTAWAAARYMEYDWRPLEIAAQHEEPGALVDTGAWAVLVDVVAKEGQAAAVERYRALVAERDGAPRTGESRVNALAYGMLARGRTDDALALFRLLVAAHPLSPNAHDGLSDACERAGDSEAALASARTCLALLESGADPAPNEHVRARLDLLARARIARLTGTPPRGDYRCPPCSGACDAARFEDPGACPACHMALERVPDARDAAE